MRKLNIMEDFCIFSLFFSCFFVTLPSMTANLLRLGKKKELSFCFALDFS